jgi:Cft2 family RNA processing exonuclease
VNQWTGQDLNKLLKTEMKIKEKVYVYSETRDYMTARYIRSFRSMNEDCKRNRRDLEDSFTSNPVRQLDTETKYVNTTSKDCM